MWWWSCRHFDCFVCLFRASWGRPLACSRYQLTHGPHFTFAELPGRFSIRQSKHYWASTVGVALILISSRNDLVTVNLFPPSLSFRPPGRFFIDWLSVAKRCFKLTALLLLCLWILLQLAVSPDTNSDSSGSQTMSEKERRSWDLSTAFYNAQYHYQSYQLWWNAYLQLLQLQSEQNEHPCECFERSSYENVDNTCLNCEECAMNFPPVVHSRLPQVNKTVGPSFSEDQAKLYSPNTTVSNLYVGQEESSALDRFKGSCDKADDDEDFEMEVDEQFVKFLQQSKHHREERDRMRSMLLSIRITLGWWDGIGWEAWYKWCIWTETKTSVQIDHCTISVAILVLGQLSQQLQQMCVKRFNFQPLHI